MKIGILTFHFAHNSGAVLQAYALQKVLKELGHEVFVIDYVPEELKKFQYKKYKIFPNKKNLPLKIKIRIMSRLICNFFIIANRIKKYEKFASENFNLTSTVTKKELDSLDFDAYVLGSDQIWNEGGLPFEDAYFGAFVNKNKSKVISYAASLGENSVEDEQNFERLLKNLDHISVREEQSVEFVEKFTEKNVANTLDPTLLVNTEEWIKDFKLDDNPKGNVIFISLVRDNNDNSVKFAKKLAKDNKLNLISLVNFKEFKLIKMIINTPYVFLNLIKNACYIVTDSFHGVVFSIIFKKEFFVIKRDAEKAGKANCSFRIENLLNKLKIKGRFIGEEVKEIDYDNVYKILEKEREKSIKFLKDSLKED